MDLSVISQLRTKKFWWMDVILYFAISLLIAALFCYGIFWVKNAYQRQDIQKENAKLLTVGTNLQKTQEAEVMDYRAKVNDFTKLLTNHEFASNVFAFLQSQTMANVWFKQFSFSQGNKSVQLSGEADNFDAFSRQVAIFEKNKYVKDIGSINSSVVENARISFNANITLDDSVFDYLADMQSLLNTTSPTTDQPGQVSAPNGNNPQGNANPGGNQAFGAQSAKVIISFKLALDPEVTGIIDQTTHTITLGVPYGTDIKNLTPVITASPGATITPASGVAHDFTSIVFRVTAQDFSWQDYNINLIVGAPATQATIAAAKQTNQALIIAIIAAASFIVLVIVVVLIIVIRRRSAKRRTTLNT